MKRSYILYCIILVISANLMSCVPQTCSEETESLAGVTFYRAGTGKIEAPDSVTIYCLKDGTRMFYERLAKREVVYLPLNASAEKSVFILKINQIIDTVTLDYTSNPCLISKECGYTFCYSVSGSRSTKNIIDTIIVTNNRITTRNEENLRLFY